MQGLILQKLNGRTHALRLSLGAFFAIDREVEGGLTAALNRIHLGTFFTSDVLVMLHHLLVGGGASHVDSATAIEGMNLSDVAAMRFACVLAVDRASHVEGEPAPKKSKKGKASEADISQGAIYRTAFSIGLKPTEVDGLTVWQWEQCIKGFNEAHGAETDSGSGAPSQEHVEAMFAELDRKERERAAKATQPL